MILGARTGSHRPLSGLALAVTVFATTVVPVAHARAERLTSERAVEEIHSGTCPRLHDDATCRACADGTELPDVAATTLRGPARVLDPALEPDVSPPQRWRFPGNPTRAPPLR